MGNQTDRDAWADLKQAEESSLPNSLPNTPQNQKYKPELSRTLGLLGAIAVIAILVGIYLFYT